jgi:hypothetical protein
MVPGHGKLPSSSKARLEACELFVFVVAVDGDLVDQAVELGIGSSGWAHGGTGLFLGGSGGWVQPVQDERRAADLTAFEAADRAVHADGRGVLVEFHDVALDAVQVAGAGVVVDPDAVADVEHRECFRGADRLHELVAGVDRVRDRGQVRVELAGGDLVKQQPFGLPRVRDQRRACGRQLGLGLTPCSSSGALAHGRKYPKRRRRIRGRLPSAATARRQRAS